MQVLKIKLNNDKFQISPLRNVDTYKSISNIQNIFDGNILKALQR